MPPSPPLPISPSPTPPVPPSPLHPFTASPLDRSTASPLHRYILLTIDVEDWFQVENLKSRIPFSSWDSRELRVERNTHRLLDLFDSFSSTPKATFFILGWIAQRLPHLVTEIHRRGHEVASHGYHHELCYNLDPAVLKDDLIRSRKLLEDFTGAAVHGYRAPNFSITDDILKVIEDCGYRYDSSYNSFSGNGRYGKVNLTAPRPTVAHELSKSFYELPISNLNVGRHTLPLGGGGYFRLAPLPLFLFGIKWVLSHQDACILYLHPWEIDPDQPQVDGLRWSHRFRHYTNLDKTFPRLEKVFNTFPHCAMTTCRQYLSHVLSKDAEYPDDMTSETTEHAG